MVCFVERHRDVYTSKSYRPAFDDFSLVAIDDLDLVSRGIVYVHSPAAAFEGHGFQGVTAHFDLSYLFTGVCGYFGNHDVVQFGVLAATRDVDMTGRSVVSGVISIREQTYAFFNGVRSAVNNLQGAFSSLRSAVGYVNFIEIFSVNN